MPHNAMRSLLFFLLSFLVSQSPAIAQDDPFGGFGGEESNGTDASFVSEVSSIAPGASFSVGLKLEHPPEWHSYYKNSGGIEQSLSIEWSLPDGFTAGAIQWPVPKAKEGFSGMSFIYSGSPIFLVEITAPPTLKVGDKVTITATPKWQICKETCKDEPKPEKDFSVTLTVAEASDIEQSNVALFNDARSAMAKTSSAFTAKAEKVGKQIQLRLTPQGGAAIDLNSGGLDFIPNEPFVESLSGSGSQITRDGDDWLIMLNRKTKDLLDNPIEQGASLSGVLVRKSPLDTASGASAIVVSETELITPPAPPLSFAKFLPVLGGMLLGGLILNLMPCVFPVIGLKIMGFVQQAGEDRKKIILHGIAFTVGVLISFWILSGILFALRSAGGSGEEVGWGYQLQKPWLVLSLMLLMFVMGLSMYGVFEIGASATGVGGKLQSKSGLGGSFFSGVLATIVATPCSAPFLGAAIGIAVSLPAAQFFTAFTFMALGLSLPYLILSIFPKLVDMLPRPGPWMESFKQAMSFLLFATAGFLLWVYVGQIKLENMLNVVIGLSMIAIAGWIFGRWHTPVKSTKARTIAKVLTLVFAVGGFLACKPPTDKGVDWQPWSEETVAELLDEETPVYIDFTAQWCATCQLNKKRAYPEEIVKMMEERGIVALKADKTSANPAIEAALQELDRSAIPVNVLYVPGKEPIITPELLSSGYLKELFEKEVPLPKTEE